MRVKKKSTVNNDFHMMRTNEMHFTARMPQMGSMDYIALSKSKLLTMSQMPSPYHLGLTKNREYDKSKRDQNG